MQGLTSNWELIVVLVVVALALFWGVRTAWRSVRGGKICSDCADSGSCPLADNPEFLERIGRDGKLPLLDKCGPGRTTCAELAETFALEEMKETSAKEDTPTGKNESL